MQWSSYPDPCFVVEWGERDHSRSRATALPTTLGRFYGHSEAAITAFMGRCHKSPSSAVPEPCSPTAP
ncbi:DUF6302 family protein [Streptomyces sp. NPDC052507]|uniref:DUF6302 family protein n=1 Tax=unclassified Streptomyces TaxID=2593676 RepID=UPI003435ADF0